MGYGIGSFFTPFLLELGFDFVIFTISNNFFGELTGGGFDIAPCLMPQIYS